MTLRSFFLVTALALLATAGATVAVLQDPRPVTVVQSETPAFPALRADPDAVARVVVEGPGGRVELSRREGGAWVATNKYDHPAEGAKIRRMVVRLSDMHLVEAKTRREDLLYRLKLQDPDQEGAASHSLRLLDEEGTAIVEAVFGQRHWRRAGAARNGIYFRHADSHQAWLAGGGFTFTSDPVQWLDDVILDIPGEAVKAVTVAPRSRRQRLSHRPPDRGRGLCPRGRPGPAAAGSGGLGPSRRRSEGTQAEGRGARDRAGVAGHAAQAPASRPSMAANSGWSWP